MAVDKAARCPGVDGVGGLIAAAAVGPSQAATEVLRAFARPSDEGVRPNPKRECGSDR